MFCTQKKLKIENCGTEMYIKQQWLEMSKDCNSHAKQSGQTGRQDGHCYYLIFPFQRLH